MKETERKTNVDMKSDVIVGTRALWGKCKGVNVTLWYLLSKKYNRAM